MLPVDMHGTSRLIRPPKCAHTPLCECCPELQQEVYSTINMKRKATDSYTWNYVTLKLTTEGPSSSILSNIL